MKCQKHPWAALIEAAGRRGPKWLAADRARVAARRARIGIEATREENARNQRALRARRAG